MNHTSWEKFYKWMAIFSIISCFLVGFAGIIGWHFHNMQLLKILPESTPIHYYAACLYIFSGFSLLYIFLEIKQFNLTRWTGIFFAVIGIVGLIEPFFHQEEFLSKFLSEFFAQLDPTDQKLYAIPTQMTLLSFLFVGLAFTLFSHRSFTRLKSIAIIVLGLLAFNIGTFSLLHFFAPVTTNIFYYQETQEIAFLGAVGMIVLGLGIVFLINYFDIRNNININKAKPFLIFLSLTFLSLLICLGLYLDELKTNESEANYLILVAFISSVVFAFFVALFSHLLNKEEENVLEITKIKNVLEEYKGRLNLALKKAGVSTLVINQNGKILWDEYASSNFFGRSKNFIPPQTVTDLFPYIHPEDRDLLKEELQYIFETKKAASIVFRVLHPNKRIHFISSRISFFYEKKTQEEKIAGTCLDITEDKYNQIILEIFYRVKKILGDAENVSSAIPKILKLIGESLDLSIVTFWERNPASNLLICKEIWHQPRINASEFNNACHHHTFGKGEGFPGQIWQNQSHLWIKDLSGTLHFYRMQGILQAQLETAFGFPIQENGDLFGVMEFFKMTSYFEEENHYYSKLSDFIATEVTQFLQRKKYEKARSQLASIVDFAGEAIISHDLKGTILTWNKSAELILGYSAPEAIGKTIEMLFSPDVLKDWGQILIKIGQGKTVQNLDAILINKNGVRLRAYMTISPMKENESIVGACTMCQDVTEFKKAEDILLKSEEKFRDFVESSSDWIWEIDVHRKITFSNLSVKNILGYVPEEIIGTDILLLLADDDRLHKEEEIKTFSDKKKGWTNLIAKWKRKNGGIRTLESNSEPIFDRNGKIEGFRGVEKDITEQLNLDKIKREFVSMISHELRTPLTSIKGGLVLLLSRAENLSSERAKQLLEISYQNCERLITIINDILEIEKIESGGFEIHNKSTNILKTVTEAIELNKPFAARFEVNLNIDLPKDEIFVFADKSRLLQVLTNLISNAVKFSPSQESVELKVESFPSSVRVNVIDKGPGIAEDLQAHIFEKFASRSSGTIPGTGLGLSICKYIIENLGGTIQFERKENKTFFYFDLPRIYLSMPFIRPYPFKEFLAPILICSEDKEAIVTLQTPLMSHEFSKEILSNWDDLFKWVPSQNLSAIILDLDKFKSKLLDSLKKIYTKNKMELPIILIASKSIPAKHLAPQLYKGLPILAYFLKPIESIQLPELINLLKKQLFQNKPHVVYIEKDLEVRGAIKSILQGNFQVSAFSSIQEAFFVLQSDTVHLILLETLKWLSFININIISNIKIVY